MQRQHIERIVARAGETLTPLAAWLLTRLERDPGRDPLAVGHERGIAADWDPGRNPDLAAFLTQAAERVVPDAHRAGRG